MAEKKVIAVLGATGAQGGGLMRAILADRGGEFAARAITRRPDSDKARALADAGAEVVAGDLDDVESLRKAFAGAQGLFAVTNYWELFDPARETQQAKNIARAAKDAGVKHVVWSTFEDPRDRVPLDDDRMPTLMGRHKVPHFESKAEANRTFEELGVPTTYLLTSFYWDNFIHFGLGPARGADGKLAITMPLGDAKMPGIAAADIGPCVLGIFKRGSEMIGKTIGIAGEHVSGAEMAAGISKIAGEEVRYNAVDPDVYRGFGFPGAEDMGNMFQFKRDFEDDYRRARSVEETRKLHPGLMNFGQWLAQYGKRIPIGS
ncbi:MAG TPA: NmrA/HSCARG family protein [Thermoanaerobaculia bacterium]|nr:NmrA/HSCARG family protein [Thermoanaerobaculia bacterium]